MQASTGTIESCFQLQAVSRGTTKIPSELVGISILFLEILEHVLLALVPEHRFSKDQSKGHVVDERFERSRRKARPRKIGMCPGPEIAMPVSTVMSLHAEPERVACRSSTIEDNLAGKNRIGMRRPRETDPAFVAQCYAKSGTIVQIPGDSVSVDL